MRSALAGLAGLTLSLSASAQSVSPPPFGLDALSSYSLQQLDVVAQAGQASVFAVTVGGQSVVVSLEPSSVRAANFRIVAPRPTGDLVIPAPPTTTLRGDVMGEDGWSAGANVANGQLQVMLIDPAGEKWIIEPLRSFDPNAAIDQYVVYNAAAEPEVHGQCGVTDQHEHAAAPGALPEDPEPGDRICQIAIDMDFEYYQLKSSGGTNPAGVTADIETMFNSLNVIYERDVQVSFEITDIILRDTVADPYTTNNGQTLLGQMANHWFNTKQGVIRDTAHLFSGQDFAGNTLGVAYLSGVCSTGIGYGVVQVPGLSFAGRVAVSAHEIGHNFSAPHCDGNPDCRIMCSGIGGCSGIVTSFGAGEIATIKNFAATRGCLTVVPDPTLPLPFKDQFQTTTLDPVKWATLTGVSVSGVSPKPISAPNVAAMLGIAVMGTAEIDVPTELWPEPVFVNLWVSTSQVEAGEVMIVDATNNGSPQWTSLGTVTADGLNSAPMKPVEYKLPQSLYGSKFKLRLTSVGNDGADIWYADDITVSKICLTDLDNSGALDFFDFLAFQTAFSFQVDRADWDRDGQFTFFDFLAYQNAFQAGCY